MREWRFVKFCDVTCDKWKSLVNFKFSEDFCVEFFHNLLVSSCGGLPITWDAERCCCSDFFTLTLSLTITALFGLRGLRNWLGTGRRWLEQVLQAVARRLFLSSPCRVCAKTWSSHKFQKIHSNPLLLGCPGCGLVERVAEGVTRMSGVASRLWLTSLPATMCCHEVGGWWRKMPFA